MLRTLGLIFISFFLSSCAQQILLVNEFNEAETLNALREGKNTIKGSALIRQNMGGVVNCAGNIVNLIPVTTYSNERISAIYKNTSKGFYRRAITFNQPPPTPFLNDNSAFYQAKKTSQCDAQGFFKFEKIADGDFYIITTIVWIVGSMEQGGHLMLRVSVKNGETKEVVLAP